MDRLLHKLKSEGHRVLIFTQMTRMLDILEQFLNFHGHIYLRLDGTTRVDQRQVSHDTILNPLEWWRSAGNYRSGLVVDRVR